MQPDVLLIVVRGNQNDECCTDTRVKMQQCCLKKEDPSINWSDCISTARRCREAHPGCGWIETDIASLCRRVSLRFLCILPSRSGGESGFLVNEPSCCLLLTTEDLSFDFGAAAQLAVNGPFTGCSFWCVSTKITVRQRRTRLDESGTSNFSPQRRPSQCWVTGLAQSFSSSHTKPSSCSRWRLDTSASPLCGTKRSTCRLTTQVWLGIDASTQGASIVDLSKVSPNPRSGSARVPFVFSAPIASRFSSIVNVCPSLYF